MLNRQRPFPFVLFGRLSAPGAAAFTGYDIFVATGDSNKFYGSPLDAGLDNGDARIFQLSIAAPANLAIAGNDPLQLGEGPGNVSAGRIGHDVHFIKDGYMVDGLLTAGRSALIVGYVYGGTSTAGEWRATGGTPGTPTIIGGTLIDTETTRITTALALTGVNYVKANLMSDGTNIYHSAGNTLQLATVDGYRWRLYRYVQYMRNLLGPTVPILLTRATKQAIADGTGVYSTNGVICDIIIRSIPAIFPYTGVADSQNPTELVGDTDLVHFTAAEQRELALRYYTAYQAALSNVGAALLWDTAAPVSALGYPSGFTFTNNNLDVSGDANSGVKTVRATSPLRSGKAYTEIKAQAVAAAGVHGIGFCNADHCLDVNLGVASANDGAADMSWALFGGQATPQIGSLGYTNSGAAAGTTWAVNDIIMLAVDMTAGKAWMGRNGTWYNSGNPEAGTGTVFTGIVDPIFIAASIASDAGNTYRLQPTGFTYTPPVGFSAWGTGDRPSQTSVSPADDAVDVAINATLTATFGTTVVLGASGTIYLKQSGSLTVLDSWNVATDSGSGAGQVEVVGGNVLTMHLSANMANNVYHSVLWDIGVVEDGSGNQVLPITSVLTWSFLTVQAAITPTAGPQQFIVSVPRYLMATGSRQYMAGFGYFNDVTP